MIVFTVNICVVQKEMAVLLKAYCRELSMLNSDWTLDLNQPLSSHVYVKQHHRSILFYLVHYNRYMNTVSFIQPLPTRSIHTHTKSKRANSALLRYSNRKDVKDSRSAWIMDSLLYNRNDRLEKWYWFKLLSKIWIHLPTLLSR